MLFKSTPLLLFWNTWEAKIMYLILGFKSNFIETSQMACSSKFYSDMKARTGILNHGTGRWSMCASLDWCVGEHGNSWVGRGAQKVRQVFPNTSHLRVMTHFWAQESPVLDILIFLLKSLEKNSYDFSSSHFLPPTPNPLR